MAKPAKKGPWRPGSKGRDILETVSGDRAAESGGYSQQRTDQGPLPPSADSGRVKPELLDDIKNRVGNQKQMNAVLARKALKKEPNIIDKLTADWWGGNPADQPQPADPNAGFKSYGGHDHEGDAPQGHRMVQEESAPRSSTYSSYTPQYLTDPVLTGREDAPREKSRGGGMGRMAPPVEVTDNPRFTRDKYHKTFGFEDEVQEAMTSGELTEEQGNAILDDYDSNIMQKGNVAHMRMVSAEHRIMAGTEEGRRRQMDITRAQKHLGRKKEIADQMSGDMATNQEMRRDFNERFEGQMDERMAKLDNAITSFQGAGGENIFGSAGAEIAAIIFMTLTGKLGQGAMGPIIKARVAGQANKLAATKHGIEAQTRSMRHFQNAGLTKQDAFAAEAQYLVRHARLEVERLTMDNKDEVMATRKARVLDDINILEQKFKDEFLLATAQEERAIAMGRAKAAMRGRIGKSKRDELIRRQEGGEVIFRPLTGSKEASHYASRYVRTGRKGGMFLSEPDAREWKSHAEHAGTLIDTLTEMDKYIGKFNVDDYWKMQQLASDAEKAVIAMTPRARGFMGDNMSKWMPAVTAMKGAGRADYGAVYGMFKGAVGGKRLLQGARDGVERGLQNHAKLIDGPAGTLGTAYDDDGYRVEGVHINQDDPRNLAEELDMAAERNKMPNPDAIGIKRDNR